MTRGAVFAAFADNLFLAHALLPKVSRLCSLSLLLLQDLFHITCLSTQESRLACWDRLAGVGRSLLPTDVWPPVAVGFEEDGGGVW
jgi:hypothetical protein